MALVQSNSSTVASATGITLAYLSNVTAGDLLFAWVGGGGDAAVPGGTVTVSDTQVNAWTFIAGAAGLDGTSFINLYYAIAKSTGANSVTYNFTAGAAGVLNMMIGEANGLTATPLDQHNSFGQSADTHSVTTLQASEYLVAGCVAQFASIGTWSVNNSFTIQQNISEGSGIAALAFADRTVSSIGTYNAVFSNTGGGFQGSGAVIASFKAAPAPANPTKLEISLFGTKRFGKSPDQECVDLPESPQIKRVM